MAGGDAHRSTNALPACPIRSPSSRSATRRATALVKASGSSGGTATPAPACSTTLATSVPGSTLATIGRPAARIEYIFEGTLERARPRRSGTTWMSPAASSSGSRSFGCMSMNRRFSIPDARRSRSARAEPPVLGWRGEDRLLPAPPPPRWGAGARRAPAIDDEDDVGLVGEGGRGVDHKIERLGEADVAGVHHHRLPGEPVLVSVGVVPR